MTNPFDSFVRRSGLDVGRTFALLAFVGATLQFYTVVGDLFLGKVSLDFGIPLEIWVAAALWAHKPWARILTLVFAWLGTIGVSALVVTIMMGVHGNFSLTLGTAVLKNPTPFQAAVAELLMLPAALLGLGALHSSKAREEFGRQFPSLDFTTALLARAAPPKPDET